ncbi:MAG: efflux RND transporter permease subunit [Chitinophagales bacterium]|nr:efflux RND transporter permease subunit [Chitinophagales bacterium]
MSTILNNKERVAIIERSAHQVGRPIFFSTIIIIVSFLPVFLLTGQEYKLFSPLAFTKTFVLLGSAVLAITLVPVLMVIFLKGKIRPENKNPVTNFFNRLYAPVLHFALKYKKLVLVINIAALIIAVPMFIKTGSEFMPPLDEGSILFMPVTLPDVSNSEVKRILQLQDKIIKSVPEVDNVLGKAGRANTATDNAPISMVETMVILKPRSQWRPGITKDDIINELNAKLQIPGVVNGFTQPIINRINMLSTGIRTDVGLKVYGQNLDSIYKLATQMKNSLQGIDGVKDLYVEPIVGGKYLDIQIKKEVIGRYGLSEDDVNTFIETALGGMNLTTTVEGRQRFNVNARFAQDYRNNLDAIKQLTIQTADNGSIPLSLIADVKLSEGPPMINSENAMLRGTVLFNVRNRDLGSTVKESQQKLNDLFKKLPNGYSIEWSGQWENKIHADQSLRIIIPLVLILIFLLLVFIYRSWKEAMITSLSVPFALIGGVYLVYFYGVNYSVAVAVGFIALLGVAVETGVLMVIYLDEAITKMKKDKGDKPITQNDLKDAVIEGSAKRLRPKLMTVATALFGLIPILFSHETGSDVMVPIALPMIGGMITSTIHVLIVTPIIFLITKERELKKHGTIEVLGFKH